tara:strand:+ start:224 stop:463 length:240 start_codon:yes stop_codon:yes gene_type:complete
MSKKKNKSETFEELAQTFEKMDTLLEQITKNLKTLEDNFCKAQIDEVCPDEVEADKAAMEAIRDICLESLLDITPKGEA